MLPSEFEHLTSLHTGADLHAVAITGLSGDVTAAHGRIHDSTVGPCSVSRLDLTGTRLTDVCVTEVTAMEVIAIDARWQNVAVTGGRLASLQLPRATLARVGFTNLRIDYLSLAQATATDLSFTNCQFGTIDLPDARLERVAFTNCTADEVQTSGLKSQNFDLRGLDALTFTDPAGLKGATLAPRQATSHGETLAQALGIHVLAERR